MMHTTQNVPTEWAFRSGAAYADPFNEVELNVRVTSPDGAEQLVPAFWAGGGTWRVRYSSPQVGRHRWRTQCSDASNADLHGVEGELEVGAYDGANPLYRRGPLRVSDDRRHLTHADGTPFFWLADTWWMGLCQRLSWPGDFQRLTADRVAKGFTVIQIVAGLYPDMAAYDERGVNEAGLPWTPEWASVNPAYFDMADLRIDWLVSRGLAPCVLGCWGYYLPWLGKEKMKRHWRYLVARYGAYPAVWCLAGEGSMPWYLTDDRDRDRAMLEKGWSEVGRYVHEVDPFDRLVTIHPSASARQTVADPSVLDFDMLQTGHGDRASLPNTLRLVTGAYATKPTVPVINGEVCYEGIGEACRQEVQRLMFWASILNGACGHTYGANGIWQVNTRDAPYGPSPHGMSWGHTPWDEAAALPGSGQLGLAKTLLERYPWWRFEPHPEWIDPHWTADDPAGAYAAGVPGLARVCYIPAGYAWRWSAIRIKGLESDASYRAFLFDPTDGAEVDQGVVEPDAAGDWALPTPRPPVFQDWVIVLERT